MAKYSYEASKGVRIIYTTQKRVWCERKDLRKREELISNGFRLYKNTKEGETRDSFVKGAEIALIMPDGRRANITKIVSNVYCGARISKDLVEMMLQDIEDGRLELVIDEKSVILRPCV